MSVFDSKGNLLAVKDKQVTEAKLDDELQTKVNGANDAIAVQKTKPTSQYNKIWIPTTAEGEVEVPTYDPDNLHPNKLGHSLIANNDIWQMDASCAIRYATL